MKQRWLAPALLALAALGAVGVAIYGTTLGANLIPYLSPAALLAALALWGSKWRTPATIVAVAVTVAIVVLAALSIGLYFVPSAALAAMALVLDAAGRPPRAAGRPSRG